MINLLRRWFNGSSEADRVLILKALKSVQGEEEKALFMERWSQR